MRENLNILYIGSSRGTSKARFDALVLNGYKAKLIDPYEALPLRRLAVAWTHRTGGFGLDLYIKCFIENRIRKELFDLTIVDNGELICGGLLRSLKRKSARTVVLNLDNPFSGRDGRRFRILLDALSEYDVFFSPRRSSVEAALRSGAQRAIQFWQAADDRLRDPRGHPSPEAKAPYLAKVSFTGTWMEDRDQFVSYLMDQGIDIKINGPRWDKAPLYERIRMNVRLGELTQEQFYAAIAASDISLGLLSKGNLDQHTTRSIEIPALKSVLVAPRTQDHCTLYEEGREAFFWETKEECAALIRRLIDDENLPTFRENGYKKALLNNNFNSQLMRYVVENSV